MGFHTKLSTKVFLLHIFDNNFKVGLSRQPF
jgi:hypothetical protein